MPFAIVMRSGSSSQSSDANHAPSRPKPVITSSATNRISWRAAQLAQRREVARRRHDHAARALHRLDEQRGDRVRALARDRALGLGEAPARRTPRGVLPLPYACGPGTWTKPGSGRSNGSVQLGSPVRLVVASVDAVVGERARQDLRLLAPAAQLPVGADQLQRGLVRLGARVAEDRVLRAAPARARRGVPRAGSSARSWC